MPASQPPVRYAVVGLGYIAQVAVLPAFRNVADTSRLVALVSGDPQKLRRLGRRYRVPLGVGYRGYDDLLESSEVDAVYIALPNSMHKDFAVRAAQRGVHVLCEKPMAVTTKDCRAMIAAANRADVRLMVAYRMHFEAANLEARKIVRSGRLGEPRLFDSVFCNPVRPGNSRLEAALGGGTLWDLGIYCLNAARMLFDAEPTQVEARTARSADPRFREVEEMAGALLRFPGERLATFTASFAAADRSAYTLAGTKGTLKVEPAFDFPGPLAYELKVGARTTRRRFGASDQFGPELAHFSACVRSGRDPEPSGSEGLADVRVIEALYRSARTGRPVTLPPLSAPASARAPRTDRRPKVPEPELVHAQAPSPG
jgi:glucose-fructose oxidoreductase